MLLLLDNYDSFTYNVSYALGTLGQELKVVRSDTISTEDVEKMAPDAILISPGPGRPDSAGISCEVIEKFAGKIPIMGICLGHQCIGEVFGGKVVRADLPVHGKMSDIVHDEKGIFSGIKTPFPATRYHSLIVENNTLPKDSTFVVSAHTKDDIIMGLRSEELKIEGLQFHPESIATEVGTQLFKNFIKYYIPN